jgi:large subunit ribosomal protein L5
VHQHARLNYLLAGTASSSSNIGTTDRLSRYKFRSPRYYRGPYHPHQPLPTSDPNSRTFVPGPFSSPRLSQAYDATIAHDLMVIGYEHVPPGTPKPPPKQRLRSWDDSSPYFKNRPLRGPRGMEALPLLDKPITFRNIPRLDKISVSILLREAASNSASTHVAGMLLQAITTQRASVFIAKKGMTAGHRINFTQKEGKPIAVGTTMSGETMWHFLSTFVSFVLPRLKEWRGVKARSGDRNGNFTIGIPAEVVGTWPEVAITYDAYV